jgi:hypothetical protein
MLTEKYFLRITLKSTIIINDISFTIAHTKDGR